MQITLFFKIRVATVEALYMMANNFGPFFFKSSCSLKFSHSRPENGFLNARLYTQGDEIMLTPMARWVLHVFL